MTDKATILDMDHDEFVVKVSHDRVHVRLDVYECSCLSSVHGFTPDGARALAVALVRYADKADRNSTSCAPMGI